VKNPWFVLVVPALAVAAARGAHDPAQAPAPSVKTIELPPDNAMATLKPGPGLDIVESNCVTCHSTDYIVRQPGGDAKHWEPEIRKMMTVYGAEISDSDVQAIVNYLGTEYGAPAVAKPGEAQKLRASPPPPTPKHTMKATERK
jgi:sulfite dehydrogenase (cytochrome) subunit B